MGMQYSYFVPIIHLGPVKNCTFYKLLPLTEMSSLIIGDRAKFEVIRQVISEGQIVHEEKHILKYSPNGWETKGKEEFKWVSNIEEKLCYVETQVNVVEGLGVKDSFLPSFYVFYTDSFNKTYLSCGNWKYANPRVIMQMSTFGKWIDGYPSINIDKELETTYSILIINPYVSKAEIIVDIEDLNIRYELRVKPRSVEKIDLSQFIKKSHWTGQVYVYGSQRCVIYFVNHKLNFFSCITTVEHSDPFRAEKTFKPNFQTIRHKIHNYINSKRSKYD